MPVSFSLGQPCSSPEAIKLAKTGIKLFFKLSPLSLLELKNSPALLKMPPTALPTKAPPKAPLISLPASLIAFA